MSREAFLRAIHADPDDDMWRLVFADWLEENGEPDRAEFIRLQVRRAQIETPIRSLWDSGWELKPSEREAHLLAAYRLEWVGEVHDARDFEFHRGLLAVHAYNEGARRLLHDRLPRKLEQLFREGWVERLHLAVDGEDMPALAAWPYLACVSQLFLQGHSCGADGAAHLAASPNMARLTSLDMTCTFIGDEGAAHLAASPHLGQLERLRLSENSIGSAGAEALVRSTHLSRLTRLSLNDNYLGNEGCAAVAASMQLTSLRHLDLSENLIEEAGTLALSSSPALNRLTGLDLSGNRLGASGVGTLVSSPHLAALTHLHLSYTLAASSAATGYIQDTQGADLAQKLVEFARLARLAVLDLCGCAIGPAGIAALASCPHLASLEILGLGETRIGDQGACALASSPFLTGLTHLELRECNIGDEGAAALAASSSVASLRYLGLRGNKVGDTGAEALAASPHLGCLETLNLRSNDINPAGMRALIASSRLGHLEWLYLSDPYYGDSWDRATLRQRMGIEQVATGGVTTGAFAALMAALGAQNPKNRQLALQELGKLLYHTGHQTPEVERRGYGAVRSALQDPDPAVRLCAIKTLIDITPPADLVTALLPSLHDDYEQVRYRVIEFLEKYVRDLDGEAVQKLRAAVESPHRDVRLFAAGVLGRHGEKSHLVGLLQGSDDETRRYALYALQKLGETPTEALPALHEWLKAEDEHLRLDAALALLAKGHALPEVGVALEALLRGENWTKASIFSALAEAGSWPGSVELLRPALADPEPLARKLAVEALGQVGKLRQEVWPILAGTLSDPELSVRRAAVSALKAAGPPAAETAPALLAILEEPALHHEVLWALWRLGGEGAKDARAQLQTVVEEVLGDGTIEAVKRLIEAVKRLRAATGCGLREAKDFVEIVMREAGC